MLQGAPDSRGEDIGAKSGQNWRARAPRKSRPTPRTVGAPPPMFGSVRLEGGRLGRMVWFAVARRNVPPERRHQRRDRASGFAAARRNVPPERRHQRRDRTSGFASPGETCRPKQRHPRRDRTCGFAAARRNLPPERRHQRSRPYLWVRGRPEKRAAPKRRRKRCDRTSKRARRAAGQNMRRR